MQEIGFYKKPDYIKDLVKKLKQNETKCEEILRNELRNKKLAGYKLYRQKAIFVYRETDTGYDRFIIADFYCHSKKLVIEVDGPIHKRKDIKDYDKRKEYLLQQHNYKILRINNEEIESSLEKVLNKIKNSLEES